MNADDALYPRVCGGKDKLNRILKVSILFSVSLVEYCFPLVRNHKRNQLQYELWRYQISSKSCINQGLKQIVDIYGPRLILQPVVSDFCFSQHVVNYAFLCIV